MKINQLKGTVSDKKKIADLEASANDLQATIDYLSMMSGIVLPEDDKEDSENGREEK